MRWGLWDATIGLLVFIGLVLAGGLIGLIPPVREMLVDNLELANFVASVIAYGGLFLIIVRASRKGLRSLARDFGLRFKPIDLAIGLGLGIAVKIISTMLSAFVVVVSGHAPEQGNFVVAEESLWVVLNAIVLATLLAPLLEELFFRGLVLRAVYNAVARWRGRAQPADVPTRVRAVWVSVLVSGLSFMALHLYQSTDVVLLIVLGGSTLLLGVVNGIVAIRTGRIGAAVIAHVVFNGSGILLALLARAVLGG